MRVDIGWGWTLESDEARIKVDTQIEDWGRHEAKVELRLKLGGDQNWDVVDLEIDAKARKVSNRGRWVKVKPKLASDKGLTEVYKKYSANVKLCFNIPRIHTEAPPAPCVKKGLNAI